MWGSLRTTGLKGLRSYSVGVSTLSKGAVVRSDGKVCKVHEVVTRARGRGRSVAVMTLVDIFNNSRFERSVGSDAKIEVVDTSEQVASFLYATEKDAVLMTDAYEELIIPVKTVRHVEFIKPNDSMTITWCEDSVVKVDGPTYTENAVRETAQVDMTATKEPGLKPAVLDNGQVVKVPAYLKPGERIVVKLRDEKPEYVRRAN